MEWNWFLCLTLEILLLHLTGTSEAVITYTAKNLTINKGGTANISCSYELGEDETFNYLAWLEEERTGVYKEIYKWWVDHFFNVDGTRNVYHRPQKELRRYSRDGLHLIIRNFDETDLRQKCCKISADSSSVPLGTRAQNCTDMYMTDFQTSDFKCVDKNGRAIKNNTVLFYTERLFTVNCSYRHVIPASDLLLYEERRTEPLITKSRSEAIENNGEFSMSIEKLVEVRGGRQVFIIKAIGKNLVQQFVLLLQYTGPSGVPNLRVTTPRYVKAIVNQAVTFPCTFETDFGAMSRLEWRELDEESPQTVYIKDGFLDEAVTPLSRQNQGIEKRYSRSGNNLVISPFHGDNDKLHKCCLIEVTESDIQFSSTSCSRTIVLDFPADAFQCSYRNRRLQNGTGIKVSEPRVSFNCSYRGIRPASLIQLYRQGNDAPILTSDDPQRQAHNRFSAELRVDLNVTSSTTTYVVQVDYDLTEEDYVTLRKFVLHVDYSGARTTEAITATLPLITPKGGKDEAKLPPSQITTLQPGRVTAWQAATAPQTGERGGETARQINGNNCKCQAKLAAVSVLFVAFVSAIITLSVYILRKRCAVNVSKLPGDDMQQQIIE